MAIVQFRRPLNNPDGRCITQAAIELLAVPAVPAMLYNAATHATEYWYGSQPTFQLYRYGVFGEYTP